MFSGIVETKVHLLEWSTHGQAAEIQLQKPNEFDDIKIGDSIAVNGVCLTLEKFSDSQMQFSLGAETLKVTGWSEKSLVQKNLNVERSLRVSDRVHGHFVQGHVDAMGRVSSIENASGNILLRIAVPASLRALLWRKGSVAINGISLTVNEVTDIANETTIDLCIIPETIRRTNISQLAVGDLVTVEADQYARALYRFNEAKP